MSSTGASVSSQAMTAVVPKRGFRIRRDLVIGLVLGVLGFVTFVPVIMLLQLSLKNEQQMADAMWLPS